VTLTTIQINVNLFVEKILKKTKSIYNRQMSDSLPKKLMTKSKITDSIQLSHRNKTNSVLKGAPQQILTTILLERELGRVLMP